MDKIIWPYDRAYIVCGFKLSYICFVKAINCLFFDTMNQLKFCKGIFEIFIWISKANHSKAN